MCGLIILYLLFGAGILYTVKDSREEIEGFMNSNQDGKVIFTFLLWPVYIFQKLTQKKPQ